MLKSLFGAMAGAGLKLPLPWMPSSSRSTPLEPVRLPFDERPHDRSLEWWHFMGHFALDPGDSMRPQIFTRDGAPPPINALPGRELRPMSFVLSILKGQIQGITKLTSIVIVIDHTSQSYSVSSSVGALGSTYFEPTDGKAFKFHFGPPGPSRPGPPEAWSVEGGMGIYTLDLDVGEQLALTLWQDSPAMLLGTDGVVPYAAGDELAYYAWPRLKLEGVLGTGAEEKLVTGTAWMEHQWGDFPLGDYQWKYLAIDLRDSPFVATSTTISRTIEKILIFHATKAEAGSEQDKRHREVRHSTVYCMIVFSDGNFAEANIKHVSIDDTQGGDNVYPQTGKRKQLKEDMYECYPVITRVHVKPHHCMTYSDDIQMNLPEMSLTIEPIFDDQECRTSIPPSIFPRFWEGACTVKQAPIGKQQELPPEQVAALPIIGYAVTELAGFR